MLIFTPVGFLFNLLENFWMSLFILVLWMFLFSFIHMLHILLNASFFIQRYVYSYLYCECIFCHSKISDKSYFHCACIFFHSKISDKSYVICECLFFHSNPYWTNIKCFIWCGLSIPVYGLINGGWSLGRRHQHLVSRSSSSAVGPSVIVIGGWSLGRGHRQLVPRSWSSASGPSVVVIGGWSLGRRYRRLVPRSLSGLSADLVVLDLSLVM